MTAMADRRVRREIWRKRRFFPIAPALLEVATRQEVMTESRKARGVTRLHDTQKWRASWAP